MEHYYLNTDNSSSVAGEYEVHTEKCAYLPSISNRDYVGYHASCGPAIEKAESKHPGWKIDGCKHCCKDCHNL